MKNFEYKWEQFTNTDVPYVQITWETPEKKKPQHFHDIHSYS